jgi:glucose-1-phosphate thymidylyltransferase
VPPLGIVILAGPDSPTGDTQAGGRLTSLACIANRPIAEHVLDALAAAGINDVVVIIPAALRAQVHESMSGHTARSVGGVRYVEQLGTVDLHSALKLAAPIVAGRPCVVHLANGLLREPLAPLSWQPGAGEPDLTLLAYQDAVGSDDLDPATQRLLQIARVDEHKSGLGMAGVWVFGEGALAAASTADGRASGAPDVTDIVEGIAEAGGRLAIRLVNGWLRYSGDPLDLLELNRIALDRLEPMWSQAHHEGNRIEGRVVIDETASVRSSVIIGPTVIGPGAQIADAYIGPYTSVGKGVRIEGAELERSIMSEGASVMHVGGRLVSSVVGRDARIFRDFSLPRALRLQVGDGNEVALC